jgi:hypothetical protein
VKSLNIAAALRGLGGRSYSLRVRKTAAAASSGARANRGRVLSCTETALLSRSAAACKELARIRDRSRYRSARVRLAAEAGATTTVQLPWRGCSLGGIRCSVCRPVFEFEWPIELCWCSVTGARVEERTAGNRDCSRGLVFQLAALHYAKSRGNMHRLTSGAVRAAALLSGSRERSTSLALAAPHLISAVGPLSRRARQEGRGGCMALVHVCTPSQDPPQPIEEPHDTQSPRSPGSGSGGGGCHPSRRQVSCSSSTASSLVGLYLDRGLPCCTCSMHRGRVEPQGRERTPPSGKVSDR